MKKIYISIILMIFLSTTSCNSIRSALGGTKMENSDEFLVEKKNPLVLPPDYSSLPQPNLLGKNDTEEEEIEKIVLSIEKNLQNKDNTPSDNSIEEFVLKNINKN